jgi:cytochrome P450
MSDTIIPTELVAPIFNPQCFADRDHIKEVLRRLRAEYPLSQAVVEGYDPHWIVTKYDDIREITRQDHLFLNAERSKTLASKMAEQMMRDYSGGKPHVFQTLVHMDEPMHRDYRAVTADEFMPQALQKYDGLVAGVAEKYVAKMAEATEMDFAHEIAFQYPLEVVCDLIGIPAEDRQKMLRLTQWMFTYADPDLRRPGADITDPREIVRTWEIVYSEWRDYFMDVVAERRACPRSDLATLIANGKVNGCPMEERAMVSYLIIAASAGHDTTAATTATSMWMLATQSGLLHRLKDDPSLIRGFIEESIRWASPVQHFIRSAAEDYQLRGRTIRKGDLLYISYISGNNDEDIFDEPHVFKADRKPNRHIGFGFGTHICLGQHLARMEMTKFWQTLIPKLTSVELAGEAKMAEAEFVCGPKSVPIRYRMQS